MDRAVTSGIGPEYRLEQWINDYGNQVLRLCYVYLSDAALAEDAMQDTFLKAWQTLSKYEGRNNASEKSWLMRIAINTCKDYHRMRWFKHVDMSRSLEEVPEPLMSVLPKDRDLMLDILDLPQREKQVILLYYYQDMTMKEIAEILHTSVSTVHHRIEKARQRLKLDWNGRDINV